MRQRVSSNGETPHQQSVPRLYKDCPSQSPATEPQISHSNHKSIEYSVSVVTVHCVNLTINKSSNQNNKVL